MLGKRDENADTNNIVDINENVPQNTGSLKASVAALPGFPIASVSPLSNCLLDFGKRQKLDA